VNLPDIILRLVSLALALLCLSCFALSIYEAASIAPAAAWWLIGSLGAGIGLMLVEVARSTPDPFDHDPR